MWYDWWDWILVWTDGHACFWGDHRVSTDILKRWWCWSTFLCLRLICTVTKRYRWWVMKLLCRFLLMAVQVPSFLWLSRLRMPKKPVQAGDKMGNHFVWGRPNLGIRLPVDRICDAAFKNVWSSRVPQDQFSGLRRPVTSFYFASFCAKPWISCLSSNFPLRLGLWGRSQLPTRRPYYIDGGICTTVLVYVLALNIALSSMRNKRCLSELQFDVGPHYF